METIKKRIVIWDTYGCTTTTYVLGRFRDEGRGAIFSHEYQPPHGGIHDIIGFLEGDEEVMLVQSRDQIFTDLITLLAKKHRGVKVKMLPSVPGTKYDPDWPYQNKTRCLRHDEIFDVVMELLDDAVTYKVKPKEKSA